MVLEVSCVGSHGPKSRVLTKIAILANLAKITDFSQNAPFLARIASLARYFNTCFYHGWV